jgi:hypothetical protein
VAGLALAAACGLPGGPSSQAASSARTATQGGSGGSSSGGSGAARGSVWVIATVPVQLHGAADVNSGRVTLLSWGQHLKVEGSQKAGADTFLQVKTDDGTQGWVLDRSDILIHRSVSKHITGTFQILYPSEWSVSGDNPVTFSSPGSDPEGISLLVQTAADTPQLPQLPLRKGQAIGDDSVQVGNPTYVLHSYRLDQGGFESDVSFKQGNTAYLFDFRQSRGSKPDLALYETLLGTTMISG